MTQNEKKLLRQCLFDATMNKLGKKDAMKRDKSKEARAMANDAAVEANVTEFICHKLMPKDADKILQTKENAEGIYKLQRGHKI